MKKTNLPQDFPYSTDERQQSARINVTKTFLPPIEEYQAYLGQIWDRYWLTNQGPLLQEFEKAAKDYLGVHDFHFVANGTLALQLALRVFGITEGEVITTPFTYVATTSAILWERCKPVYVDIRPDTFCIDADKIEAAITPRTRAIMPVHAFGNRCDTDKIDAIAKKHKLKVIYDAAHAFGATYNDRSLLDYGDISICSFHTAKLFHTIEGGSITARDQEISKKIELMKRFGHHNDDHYMLGINAKASEFQAAMGLCNLKYVDQGIEKRKALFEIYDALLDDDVQKPTVQPHTKHNYGYYPVVFESENRLLDVTAALNAKNIFPRRYFYPSLNTLPYLEDKQVCPISDDISKRVLCLPLHAELQEETVRSICAIIKR